MARPHAAILGDSSLCQPHVTAGDVSAVTAVRHVIGDPGCCFLSARLEFTQHAGLGDKLVHDVHHRHDSDEQQHAHYDSQGSQGMHKDRASRRPNDDGALAQPCCSVNH